MTSGEVIIDGHDVVRDYRAARSIVGLVPQEIALDIFSTVHRAATFSRGLFGRPPDPAYIEQLLHELSLWDKRDTRIVELSGGMKRRVMIAKALSHQPDVLFLDEPTAASTSICAATWALVRRLRRGRDGHSDDPYIEEPRRWRTGRRHQQGGSSRWRKAALMRKLGKRRLTLALQSRCRRCEGTRWLAARTGGRRPPTILSLFRGAEDTWVPIAFASPQRDRRRFRISTPAQRRLKTSSLIWWRAA
jgi:ABC-2 type transport system ATP-binding protein